MLLPKPEFLLPIDTSNKGDVELMFITENPDYLFPIDKDNRNEVFLIEFKNFIRHETEMMVIHMIKNRDKYIERYPRLDLLGTMENADIVFENIMLYSPLGLLTTLIVEDIPHEELQKDLEEMKPHLNYLNTHPLRLEALVNNLMDKPFIKKVYIIDEEMSEMMQEYLSLAFKTHANKKLIAVKGKTTEFIDEHPELTTIFINSSTMLKELIDRKTFDKTLFVLNYNFENLAMIEEEEILVINYELDFTKFNTETSNRITYIYPYYIKNEIEGE